MSFDYDVIVIGGGPGGYVAAIRASQLGKKVACIEKAELGGICLNWGCIPTKALLRSVEVLELCRKADQFGVLVDNVRFDFDAMIKRSRGISSKINKGVGYLLRKNNIENIVGTASLASPHQVTVGEKMLSAAHIIVATGARARQLPGLEFDGKQIIDYRKAMTLEKVPKSMVVIGGGAIGVEFGSFYAALGTEVTIVEYQDRIVPVEDDDISAELAKALTKHGIKILTGTKVTSAIKSSSNVLLTAEPASGGASTPLEAEIVLVAAGISGNVENLGLDSLGIGVERGFIETDESLQTMVASIYAIGDVTGPPALAHVASAEGVFAAEHLAGLAPSPIPYDSIPACTYCHPEIASVGMTERECVKQGIEFNVGKFPFKPLGKTMAAGEYPGFVKTLYRKDNGALLGAHLIGPAVTDLIGEMTLAKTTEVNAQSLVYTVHAHPTFAEALKEATEDALGHAIHL